MSGEKPPYADACCRCACHERRRQNPHRPDSRAWYAALEDDELMRLARGNNAVDRAVDSYRRRQRKEEAT
jgi:hypothetical protein